MLNIIWFILLFVLMAGYAILDGFDLGVGILHLFNREDRDRRVLMNAIGPVWDGNEVWLITLGGALFAAFRVAYATVFSLFYTAFMLLLCALILRAASLEFRGQFESPRWRNAWDFVFSLSSFVAALLFGVAAGNLLRGLAIRDLVFEGTFFSFLNLFSLLTGLLVVSLFALHGALYLRLKTEGELQVRVGGWARSCAVAALVLYIVASLYGLATIPHLRAAPLAWVGLVGGLIALYGAFRFSRTGKNGRAFVSSALSLALLVFVLAAALFPNLVVSSIDPAFTLNITNAACSQKTLGIMLLIVLCGLPIVLLYTAWVYRVFWGKVKVDRFSY